MTTYGTDAPPSRFRIERVSPGTNRWRITDGQDAVECDADLSTARGAGSVLLAATSEWGTDTTIIAEVKRLTAYLTETGMDSAGPEHEELRAAFRAIAGAAADDEAAPVVSVRPFTPFPVNVLPRVLADLVNGGAKALGCDPSQIALPVLAACSASIGNSRRIMLKESWKEPAVLWAVTVLPSGALKSPALDLGLEPIRRAQGEAIREYQEQMARHEADVEEWARKDKRTRGDKPGAPVCARIVVSDSTVEGLASILASQASGRGLLCERDEASGWLKSFNQYKAKGGADEAHWLTMHRAGGLTMDRKTGDERLLFCPRAFVSFTGTIQPGILRLALLPEHRESGLSARLLLAMPPVRRRQWSEAVVSKTVQTRYGAMLAALMELPMGGVIGDQQPIDLPLTAGAKALWVDFYNAHNAAEQASEGGDISAAWSKLEGYAARLALIVYCARMVDEGADPDAVDGVSMTAGITLARWFGGEAERVYAMLGGDAQTDEHRALWQWIRERGGRITARELRNSRASYHAAGAARDALSALVEAGYGRWVEVAPGPSGGRPVSIFEAAPAASPKPPLSVPIPASPIPETPRHDSASGGNADGDSVDGIAGEGIGDAPQQWEEP
ncbi:MAG TPA: YfjI family protein [Phycisphaerae bacterium]|nr:YfjI family protein [Phycisphaerae bacterium]